MPTIVGILTFISRKKFPAQQVSNYEKKLGELRDNESRL